VLRAIPTLVLLCCLIFIPPTTSAQSLDDIFRKGATELGFHAGGAITVPGGKRDRNYWMLAARWGRIVTPQIAGGALRGNVEYGIEAVPAIVMRQSSTVYGGGFEPVQFRYNFTAAGAVVPYFEIGSGILVSTSQVPEGTSRFNFASHGGFGVHVVSVGRSSVALGARYMHISNAGIGATNPGINTVYFYTGLSWWR
jgi:Lipid A 3-O-deacylase (PagL)